MNVTQKSHYAVLALMCLARQPEGQTAAISEICGMRPIPNQFLQIILRELRQGGFVESRRGKKGGFALTRPATQITVGDVVRFIDGPAFITECSRPDYNDRCGCAAHCALQEVWREVSRKIDDTLRNKTIADLVEREQQLTTQAPRLAEFTI